MPTMFLLLGVLLMIVAVHPFASYPLSLMVLGRIAPPTASRVRSGLGRPRVAVCVCAYNEARVIRAKAENMIATADATRGAEVELLIYVDAATDGTAGALRDYDGRIRVVEGQMRRGKSHGMNQLVAATDADIIVFSDANVMFAPDAIERLIAPFSDATVGCVCGHLVYTATDSSATAATGGLYWRIEEWVKALETRTGSVMGADGSIFAIRRACHRPPPPDIIDDMYVSLSILCDGYRVVRADDAIAYEESVSHSQEEFRRKQRIACQAFNVHRLLWPRLRRLPAIDLYKYVSHKLLRWMTGPLLALGVSLVLLGLLFAGAGVLVVCAQCLTLGLLVAGLRWPHALPGKGLDILNAFTATALGVARSLRGERFQTWNPPSSARAQAATR